MLSLPRQKARFSSSNQSDSRTALADGLYRGVAQSLHELGELQVVPVTRASKVEHAQWTDVMEAKHYLGSGAVRESL